MENQGKRKSQIEDSGIFLFIAGISLIISILLMFLLGGCSSSSSQNIEEEKILITMSDGKKLELVADEYGGQYLRQNTKAGVIYIPYMGAVEETDTLRFYNAKNK